MSPPWPPSLIPRRRHLEVRRTRGNQYRMFLQLAEREALPKPWSLHLCFKILLLSEPGLVGYGRRAIHTFCRRAHCWGECGACPSHARAQSVCAQAANLCTLPLYAWAGLDIPAADMQRCVVDGRLQVKVVAYAEPPASPAS